MDRHQVLRIQVNVSKKSNLCYLNRIVKSIFLIFRTTNIRGGYSIWKQGKCFQTKICDVQTSNILLKLIAKNSLPNKTNNRDVNWWSHQLSLRCIPHNSTKMPLIMQILFARTKPICFIAFYYHQFLRIYRFRFRVYFAYAIFLCWLFHYKLQKKVNE